MIEIGVRWVISIFFIAICMIHISIKGQNVEHVCLAKYINIFFVPYIFWKKTIYIYSDICICPYVCKLFIHIPVFLICSKHIFLAAYYKYNCILVRFFNSILLIFIFLRPWTKYICKIWPYWTIYIYKYIYIYIYKYIHIYIFFFFFIYYVCTCAFFVHRLSCLWEGKINIFPESVWAQGSSNSGGLWNIFSS